MEIKNIEIQDSDGNVFYPHTNASVVKATDTSGLDGIAGKSSDTQTLLDKLADRVANKLIEKGMIANNLVTDNENMVLAAPMGKKLQEQISDVNKNIVGNDVMKHLPFNTADLNPFNIDDTKGNWIAGFTETGEGTYLEKWWQNIAQFDTQHFRSQLSIKSFADASGIPRLGIRSWWGGNWTNWNPLVTNSDLPIFETFIPTFNNTDTVAITLQHKVIDGGHIFVTNGDFVACPVPIVGIRLPDGDRTNKVEVRFASNIVGVARINILYKPYYS